MSLYAFLMKKILKERKAHKDNISHQNQALVFESNMVKRELEVTMGLYTIGGGRIYHAMYFQYVWSAVSH